MFVDEEALQRFVLSSGRYQDTYQQQGADAAAALARTMMDATLQLWTEQLHATEHFFGTPDGGAARRREGAWRQVKEGVVTRALELKIESQVMLMINLDQEGGAERMLVNGSRGVVSRTQKTATLISEREHQLRRLGAGVDEDGMVDDEIHIGDGPLRKYKEELSRLREYEAAGFDRLCYVDFWNGRTDVLIEPHTFRYEVAGRGKCERMQLPLKLAWSITCASSARLLPNAACSLRYTHVCRVVAQDPQEPRPVHRGCADGPLSLRRHRRPGLRRSLACRIHRRAAAAAAH